MSCVVTVVCSNRNPASVTPTYYDAISIETRHWNASQKMSPTPSRVAAQEMICRRRCVDYVLEKQRQSQSQSSQPQSQSQSSLSNGSRSRSRSRSHSGGNAVDLLKSVSPRLNPFMHPSMKWGAADIGPHSQSKTPTKATSFYDSRRDCQMIAVNTSAIDGFDSDDSQPNQFVTVYRKLDKVSVRLHSDGDGDECKMECAPLTPNPNPITTQSQSQTRIDIVNCVGDVDSSREECKSQFEAIRTRIQIPNRNVNNNQSRTNPFLNTQFVLRNFDGGCVNVVTCHSVSVSDTVYSHMSALDLTLSHMCVVCRVSCCHQKIVKQCRIWRRLSLSIAEIRTRPRLRLRPHRRRTKT